MVGLWNFFIYLKKNLIQNVYELIKNGALPFSIFKPKKKRARSKYVIWESEFLELTLFPSAFLLAKSKKSLFLADKKKKKLDLKILREIVNF
jgi:hypothetical protein